MSDVRPPLDQTPHLVTVWADLTSPWCYVGRARLNHAISAYARPKAVIVRHRPVESDPELPVNAGLPARDALRRRGMTGAEADELIMAVQAAAATEHLPMEYDRAIAANTFSAHRMVELAWREGGSALQSAVVERLMAGHFAEGLSLDDPNVLIRLGPEAGLEEGAIRALLHGFEFVDHVRDARIEVAAMHLAALPVMVVDNAHRLDGAHGSDVVLALLNQGTGVSRIDALGA